MYQNKRIKGFQIMTFLLISGLVLSIIPLGSATVEGGRAQRGTRQPFTHTVFAEEITATWCVHCPYVATALSNIYDSNDYDFYFIAMIADVNDLAQERANYSHYDL
jgi:thiol-disulfide isomerase/thioredoxin